jgi:hypothetical protein
MSHIPPSHPSTFCMSSSLLVEIVLVSYILPSQAPTPYNPSPSFFKCTKEPSKCMLLMSIYLNKNNVHTKQRISTRKHSQSLKIVWHGSNWSWVHWPFQLLLNLLAIQKKLQILTFEFAYPTNNGRMPWWHGATLL